MGRRGMLEADLLVAGAILAVAGLAVGLATAGGGAIRGLAVRGARNRAEAPSPGSIPGERHRQTRSAAAR